MPAYGYSNGIVDEFGLHNLSDVSFSLSARQLCQVADLLTSCAEEIESGVGRTSHRHMGERDLGWKEIDVVVNHPAPDPPRQVL